jgi:glutathione S-transferase
MGAGASTAIEKPTLFGLGFSGNCQKCMLFVDAYCKDQVDFKVCDILKGEQMTEEFLAINPNHQIPTLQVGKEGISESNTILRFLANTYKPELYPSDPLAQAKVDMVLDYISSTFYPTCCPGLGYMYVGYAPMNEETRAANEKKMMEEIMPRFEALLAKQAYLGGDSLSIADFCYLGLAPFLAGNKALGEAVKVDGKFPKIFEYSTKVSNEIPGIMGEADPTGYREFFGFCKSKGEEYHAPKAGEDPKADEAK